MEQLLTLENVHKSYGSFKVTEGVGLSLGQGEALGIIGPNGAGKSTLFNLIAGGVFCDEGSIQFDGHEVTREPVFRRCYRGIGRSHQIPHPFVKMSVFENLLVGASFGGQLSGHAAQEWCVHVLELTGLLKKANQPAGSLTLLDRKRLEMARALSTQPKLLLLDEIAGGLTEPECHALVETIQGIHKGGTSIIWIEHIVHALLAVVSRLMVLNFGRRIAEGDPHQVMADRNVQEIYMGNGSSVSTHPLARQTAKHGLLHHIRSSTGMRWHVRAYCEKNGEYRDFVLSRFRGTPELMDDVTEHTRLLDPGWTTPATVILQADSRLKPAQRALLEADYGMEDGQLVIETRGALVQYVLNRYQIDTTKMHMKPSAQQLMVANMEELTGWLY